MWIKRNGMAVQANNYHRGVVECVRARKESALPHASHFSEIAPAGSRRLHSTVAVAPVLFVHAVVTVTKCRSSATSTRNTTVSETASCSRTMMPACNGLPSPAIAFRASLFSWRCRNMRQHVAQRVGPGSTNRRGACAAVSPSICTNKQSPVSGSVTNKPPCVKQRCNQAMGSHSRDSTIQRSCGTKRKRERGTIHVPAYAGLLHGQTK